MHSVSRPDAHTGAGSAGGAAEREALDRWKRVEASLRQKELEVMEQEKRFMDNEQRSIAVRNEQAHLDNARRVWLEFAERNTREVMEKAEQLKAIAGLAALVAGFALVSFLQFQYTYDDTLRWFSPAVQPMYAFTLAAAVALEMSSVVLCSLMLASILRTSKSYVSEQEEAEFMARARTFALGYRLGDRPPGPQRTFSAHWLRRCERDWRLAFRLFYAGTTCFFCNVLLAGWIKFATSLAPALIVTVVMALALVYNVAIFFSSSDHLLQSHDDHVEDAVHRLSCLSPAGLPFDWHLPPLPSVLRVTPGARTGFNNVSVATDTGPESVDIVCDPG